VIGAYCDSVVTLVGWLVGHVCELCLNGSSEVYIYYRTGIGNSTPKNQLDASCLSVVSFNSTKRRAQSSIISYTVVLDLPLRKLNYVLFGVFTGAAWLSVPQTDLHRDCDTPLDGRPSVDSTSSSRHRSSRQLR